MELQKYSHSINILDFIYRFYQSESNTTELQIHIDICSSFSWFDMGHIYLSDKWNIHLGPTIDIIQTDYDGSDYEETALHSFDIFSWEKYLEIIHKRLQDILKKFNINIESYDIQGSEDMKLLCKYEDKDIDTILQYIENKISYQHASATSLAEMRNQIWNRIISKFHAEHNEKISFPINFFNDIERNQKIFYIPEWVIKPKDMISCFEIFIPENPTILFWYYFLFSWNLKAFSFDEKYLYFHINNKTGNYYEWQEWIIRFYESTSEVYINNELQWILTKDTPEYKFFKILYNKPNYQFEANELKEAMNIWRIDQTSEEYLKKVKNKIGKTLWKEILNYIISKNKTYTFKK